MSSLLRGSLPLSLPWTLPPLSPGRPSGTHLLGQAPWVQCSPQRLFPYCLQSAGPVTSPLCREQNGARTHKALRVALESLGNTAGAFWDGLLGPAHPLPLQPLPATLSCSPCSRMCHMLSHCRTCAHTVPSASTPLLHATSPSPLPWRSVFLGS